MKVLDAMAGCGVRGLRYLTQANVDFVWCNDNNQDLQELLDKNLSRSGRSKECWHVSKCETNRLFMKFQLGDHTEQESQYFDLVDIDSQGADSSFFGNALGVVKFGGMLYVTCTDGFSSSGKRPQRALANYGTWTHFMPFSNEIGLRMLIGALVREGSMRGIKVSPLFSLYSPHGPVFRAMLRIEPGRDWLYQQYAFIGHCYLDGNSQIVHWENLSQAWCKQRKQQDGDPTPMKLCGPLWTGPLHNLEFVQQMELERGNIGWTGSPVGFGSQQESRNKRKRLKSLEGLLSIMIDESDPQLPPWYILIDKVGQLGGLKHVPSLQALLSSLQDDGFSASRSHVEDTAIKTNASMSEVIKVAKQIVH